MIGLDVGRRFLSRSVRLRIAGSRISIPGRIAPASGRPQSGISPGQSRNVKGDSQSSYNVGLFRGVVL
jgi:hypothetical protein